MWKNTEESVLVGGSAGRARIYKRGGACCITYNVYGMAKLINPSACAENWRTHVYTYIYNHVYVDVVWVAVIL